MSMLGFLTFSGDDPPDLANVTEDDTVNGVAGTYHEAEVGEVVDGVMFGAASALEGTYPTTEATIAAITWPALDEVDGLVKFGPVTGLEYEGTGVNATTLGTILDARGITSANKAQTGDSYAIVNGDHGLVSIQDDIDAILTSALTIVNITSSTTIIESE